MALTQTQLALQMLAQLRTLDPSVSAEIGTPERKILDTVAQALADSQVDLTQLNGSLDIDSKYGGNLDRFLALFGFGRQAASPATGFVTFSRDVPSNIDIRIPSGTQVMLPPEDLVTDDIGHTSNPIYETTFDVTLIAGEISVDCPIRAVVAGTIGNLEAGHHFAFVGSPVFGIVNTINNAPVTGGVNREDDDQLKTRFKNTIFRNLAGTQDQYMALAVSTAFTTKANVIGPISRYREYIQVPLNDDSDTPGGQVGIYSSALSTIPYSKHTYESIPAFISNGNTGSQILFYQQDIDWVLNTLGPSKNFGDAFREYGDLQDVDPTSPAAAFRPNVSFERVYLGSDPTVDAIRPNDIVLFEHSYMSTASRNNYDRNITNAVDVFIDGSNNVVTNTIVPTPIGTTMAFDSTPTSKLYNDNYRRSGNPDTPPTVGHFYFPLYWQPITSVPSEITISTDTSTATYYLNEHYFFIEDITDLHGTVRARNGIEWNPAANGALSSTDGTPGARTGPKLTDFPTGTPVAINGYTFDKNIVDLQSVLEAQKQITTDILVHQARTRYFKLDISVMYSSGYNPFQVNEQIRDAVNRYFKSLYFGSVVQLSDILSVIHDLPGVDNVRWTSDLPNTPDTNRMFETNQLGTTRTGSEFQISNDFFLKDDELATLAEAVDPIEQLNADARAYAVQPGLIIRARAQNTWLK